MQPPFRFFVLFEVCIREIHLQKCHCVAEWTDKYTKRNDDERFMSVIHPKIKTHIKSKHNQVLARVQFNTANTTISSVCLMCIAPEIHKHSRTRFDIVSKCHSMKECYNEDCNATVRYFVFVFPFYHINCA